MTIAASVRLKRWARQVAQKIIVSHIKNYVACLKWETALIEDPRYYPVPLPTNEDYEHLVRDIEETGELEIVSGRENEKWVLVPTLNVIRYQINDKWYISRRPEDAGKKNVPDIAYFVVDRNVLKKGEKFKARANFGKFLGEVRAAFFGEFHKEFMAEWIKQETRKVRESATLRQHYQKDGMKEKEIQRIIRRTKKGNRMANHPSLAITARRLVQKELYPGKRKNFDKTLERLKKMGLWL